MRKPEWPSQVSDSSSPVSRIVPGMSYETVIWEQSGGIGRITLNRPETLNAWNEQFGHDMIAVLGEAADPAVRAVLISGAGRGFSSGADLKGGFDPDPADNFPNIRKE